MLVGSFFFLFVLIDFWSPLFASEIKALQDEWRWAQFTTSSGLPSNKVVMLTEASDGTVWVGTSAGIAWYDGFRFHTVDTTNGMPAREPTSLVADSSEGVYAVVDHRLFLIHKNCYEEVSKTFKFGTECYIRGVAISKQKDVLIQEKGIIYHFHDQAVTLAMPPLEQKVYGTLQLFDAGGKGAWLAVNGILYQWSNSHWEKVIEVGIPNLLFYCLAAGNTGIKLASCEFPVYMRGMWEWSQDGKLRRDIEEGKTAARCMDISPAGDAYVVYKSGDIRIRVQGLWYSLDPLPAQMKNILFLKFRANGDLWVGTESGLFLYRKSLIRWKYWKHSFPDLRNSVNEILVRRDGETWLGESDGIEIHYPDGRTQWIKYVNGRRIGIVTGLAEDHNEAVWIASGASFSGAYRWYKGVWRYFGRADGLRAIRIHKIKKDRKGDLWFLGISDDPLNLSEEPGAFQYTNGKFIHWGKENGLLSCRVLDFAQSQDNSLWFATSAGVYKWCAGKWSTWLSKPGGIWGRAFTIAADDSNGLWIGDQDNGLWYINSDSQMHSVNSFNDFFNKEVWGLQFDSQGRLWVTTKGGLACLYKGVWSFFQTNSGLNNLSLWPLMPAADKIYVGTIGSGVDILNTKGFSRQSPRIEFDDPIIEENSTLVRWRVYSYWGEQLPSEIQTRYQVDNESWSRWETTREIDFTRLSSGEHVIYVQAKSLFGVVANIPEAQFFWIQIPYYHRPLFIIPLGVLLLIVGVLTFERYRRNRTHAIALEMSEKKYRSVVEDQTELICRFHSCGLIIFANEAFCKYYNKDKLEVVGNNLSSVLSKPHWDELRSQVALLTISHPVMTKEFQAILHDGTVHWQQHTLRAIFDVNGTPEEFQTVANDITVRKNAENTLMEIQARNQALLNAMPDAMIRLSEDGTCLEYKASRQIALLFEPEEFLGRKIVDAFPDALAKRTMSFIRKALSTNEVQVYNYGLSIQGKIHYFEGRIMHVWKDEVLLIVRDISERIKAEEELKGLPKRILFAQEVERRRIARELHDSAGQMLSSVKFRIHTIAENLGKARKQLRASIETTNDLLAKTIDEVRRISHNLQPSELDDFGLTAAVRTLCEEFRQHSSLDIELYFGKLPRSLPPEIKITTYRIIQEALTNIEKHAHASHVSLTMLNEDSHIRVMVKDDGKGFTLTTHKGEKHARRKGLGLSTMSERAMLTGGTFSISTKRGAGTEITFSIPVNGTHLS